MIYRTREVVGFRKCKRGRLNGLRLMDLFLGQTVGIPTTTEASMKTALVNATSTKEMAILQPLPMPFQIQYAPVGMVLARAAVAVETAGLLAREGSRSVLRLIFLQLETQMRGLE